MEEPDNLISKVIPTVSGGGRREKAVDDNGDEVTKLDCEIQSERADLENGAGNRQNLSAQVPK